MLAIRLYERRSENKFTPHPTTDQVSFREQLERSPPYEISGSVVFHDCTFRNPCGEVQLPASGIVVPYPPLPEEPVLTRFDLIGEDL